MLNEKELLELAHLYTEIDPNLSATDGLRDLVMDYGVRVGVIMSEIMKSVQNKE